MIVLARDVWRDDDLAVAIGDAYRDAARAGVAMRGFADTLETIREALARGDDIFSVWDLLDDTVGRVFGRGQELGILVAFRASWIAVVTQHIVHRATDGATFASSFAEALVEWRLEVCQALAQLDHPELHTVIDCEPALREGCWIETLPLFEALAAHPAVELATRGRLSAIAGSIYFYHLKGRRRCRELMERARELDGEGEYVLTVCADECVERFDLEQAESIVRRVLARYPNSMRALSTLADCVLKKRDPAAAETHLRRALQLRPGWEQSYNDLMSLSVARGARPGLFDEFEQLLERCNMVGPVQRYRNTVRAGWLLCSAGKYDDAARKFNDAIALQPDRPSARSGLAGVHAAKPDGDRSEAKRIFDQLLDEHPRFSDAYWGAINLAIDQDRTAEVPDLCHRAERSIPLLASRFAAVAAATTWRLAPESERAPAEAALLRAVAESPDDDEVLVQAEQIAGEVKDPEHAVELQRAIGDTAGPTYRARLESKLGVLATAAERFDDAAAHIDAAIELEPGVAAYHVNRLALVRARKTHGLALRLLEQTPAAIRNHPEFRSEMGLLLNNDGNARYEADDYGGAIPLYARAIEHRPDDAVLYSNLAQAWDNHKEVPLLERTRNAIAALRAIPAGAARNEDTHELQRYEDVACLAELYGEAAATRGRTVEPIAVEVANDVIPLVEAGELQLQPEIMQLFKDLRTDVRERYGVVVPGIRIRGNLNDLPDGTYIILLADVPIVSSTVNVDRQLVTGKDFDLAALGIEGEEATDPVTGDGVYWISAADAERLAHGGKVLSPVAAIVHHLHYIVERNLAELIGVQETYSLLAESSELLDSIRELDGGVPFLTSVLRGLLAERTPITELGPICETLIAMRKDGHTALDIVEAIRALPIIRERLHGNEGSRTLFGVGTELERLIESSIVRSDPTPTLAMDPSACQDALTAVRNEVADRGLAALVVDQPAVRPFIRQLIELEFPDVAVLSRAELVGGRTPSYNLELSGDET